MPIGCVGYEHLFAPLPFALVPHPPLPPSPAVSHLDMSDHQSQQTSDKTEMVQVDQHPARSRNTSNGDSSTQQRGRQQQRRNPYRAADFLSNVSNFKIIESTLRGMPISLRPALRNFC